LFDEESKNESNNAVLLAKADLDHEQEDENFVF
jgi:hypothetical protein